MVPCLMKSSWVKRLNILKINLLSSSTKDRWLNTCQVERLTSRALLRVSGDDATPFLQGLVTNDVGHLQDTCQSLYTMFLNTKGRVLYDSIIYKTKDENTFLLECDEEVLKDLEKHLKMYKLRKKVSIDSVDDELKIWVLYNHKIAEISRDYQVNINQEQVVPCTLPSFENKRGDTYFNDIIVSEHSSVYIDPRLSSLGSRVIAVDNEDIVKCLENAGTRVETDSQRSYRMFRYRLGVGEGVSELPVGKCFPLEVNCDYLHGVSFHKGCYIGQELTARTHHTGVVRKRLMPLLLHSEISPGEFHIDMPIETSAEQKKSAIGKLRGIEKNCALGLMRIAEALESKTFKIGPVEGETFRPFWWPQELPKERIDSGSSKRS